MRSNTGVIGAQRLNAPSGAPGVHGLADLYDNVKGATWPAVTAATASVVPSVQSVNEGDTVAFAITAYAPAGQTTLYWSMRATTGTATAADFGDTSISGSVVMTAGYAGILTGTVSRTWASDLFTEGTEVFVLDVSLTNGGLVIGTSPGVSVADTSVSPVATVTGTPSSLNEGSAATYTITIVSGLAAGATVYWVMRTTTGTALAADFTDATLSGSYTVSAGLIDTVTRTWANDVTTEGAETWVMDVRTGSSTGPVFGTSSPATTVADTSVTAALYAFTSFTFTTAATVGATGPSQATLLASYNTATYPWLTNTAYFSATDGMQYWTVPDTATYRIVAAGSWSTPRAGKLSGRGAIFQGDFSLTVNSVVRILCGQSEFQRSGTTPSGGGGGTFVVASPYNTNASILVVAGGGGGGHDTTGTFLQSQANGSFGTAGQAGYSGGSAGGTAGSGGQGSSGGASGGAGFSGNGFGRTAYPASDGNLPVAFTAATSRGYGGGGGGSASNLGGYGGGGFTWYSTGWGGGGGGFSGGGTSSSSGYVGNAGGGGSYNNGTNQVQVGYNSASGYVTITKL